MKKEISLYHLTRFAKALRGLPKHTVDQRSIDQPVLPNHVCGSPGCHSGEAMMALDKLGVPPVPIDPNGLYNTWRYDFSKEAGRLAKYLFQDPTMTRKKLEKWGQRNPKIWGNTSGLYMFGAPTAFDQYRSEFDSSVIATWWTDVARRVRSKK